MSAFIGIQFGFDRFPSRGPYLPVLIDIKILSSIIHRYVIVPVSGKSSQSCIFIETISSGCIGNDGKELFATQVVDPWIWSSGIGNYIFSVFIVKMPVFHFKAARF
jgi:hypothetical protein